MVQYIIKQSASLRNTEKDLSSAAANVVKFSNNKKLRPPNRCHKFLLYVMTKYSRKVAITHEALYREQKYRISPTILISFN